MLEAFTSWLCSLLRGQPLATAREAEEARLAEIRRKAESHESAQAARQFLRPGYQFKQVMPSHDGGEL